MIPVPHPSAPSAASPVPVPAPVGDSTQATTTARGLLLFAHGARDPAWSAPFEAVAARCRAQPDAPAVALGILAATQGVQLRSSPRWPETLLSSTKLMPSMMPPKTL